MQQKQMTHQAEVMQLPKLKYKNKDNLNVVNYYLLILQDLRELKIAKVTIRIGRQKELRLISLY
jgi:hypothetical protein